LVAAQAELPCAIGRDAEGQIQNRTYRYLTLDKLIAETRPILQRHGVIITQCPTMMSNKETSGFVPALRTFVTHVEGESWSFATPLYLTDKSMQGLGSAITYARRYAWQSVLGIAAEEDTDAKDEIPF